MPFARPAGLAIEARKTRRPRPSENATRERGRIDLGNTRFSHAEGPQVNGRGEQVESSKARWDGQALIIVTTFLVSDRAAGQPFTVELTRKLSLESPTTLVVEATRAGVLGGPAAATRSVYRKS